MPAIDPSIPLSGKDAFTSLSGMVNTARGMQALQTGAIEQQRQGIALSQEQGALDARRALAAIVPKYQDPDTGEFDLTGFSKEAPKVDPSGYLWPEYLQKGAMANIELQKAKSAVASLSDQQRQFATARLAALGASQNLTKQDIADAGDEIIREAPQMKHAVGLLLSPLGPMKDDPDTLRQYLAQSVRKALPVGQLAPQLAYQQTNAGAVPVQANLNSPTPAGQIGTMPQIAAGVAPTQTQTQKTDLLGNQYIEERDQSGRITPKALPGATTPPLTHLPPNEAPGAMPELTAIRAASNIANRGAPDQHFNLDQIIKLADATTTGEGAKIVANLRGNAAGLPWTSDSAANYNRLGHFIALQSAQTAKAMGLDKSDARLGLSQEATLDTGWNKDAIKSAAKILKANVTGQQFFNRGMEAAIQNPANVAAGNSIFAIRKFQNDWADNYDVNAARLMNAISAGDKKEISDIVTGVGGAGSPGAQALIEKMHRLKTLITTGTIQ